MNAKQIIIIAVALMCFYLYSQAVNANNQANYKQSLPSQSVNLNCGNAPGNVDIFTRLNWGLCKSKEAGDVEYNNSR